MPRQQKIVRFSVSHRETIVVNSFSVFRVSSLKRSVRRRIISTRTTSLCKRCICQLMDLHSWFWQFSITNGMNLLYIGRSYQTELRAALLRRDPFDGHLGCFTVMTCTERNEKNFKLCECTGNQERIKSNCVFFV